jgi:hypothetical protein
MPATILPSVNGGVFFAILFSGKRVMMPSGKWTPEHDNKRKNKAMTEKGERP